MAIERVGLAQAVVVRKNKSGRHWSQVSSVHASVPRHAPRQTASGMLRFCSSTIYTTGEQPTCNRIASITLVSDPLLRPKCCEPRRTRAAPLHPARPPPPPSLHGISASVLRDANHVWSFSDRDGVATRSCGESTKVAGVRGAPMHLG